MTKIEVSMKCYQEVDTLLEKYFPNFTREAAIEKPETLADEYNDELPHKAQAEYRQWLSELWKEISPEGAKPFDEVMNLHLSMQMVDTSYVPYLENAREEAVEMTLWEKITRTNHEDVTYYVGLLRQYTKELLETMTKDFLGDIV